VSSCMRRHKHVFGEWDCTVQYLKSSFLITIFYFIYAAYHVDNLL
jgi:hypothetical protein